MSLATKPPVIFQSFGRKISDFEAGRYLDRIIPDIYAEVYGLSEHVRHQVLSAVRDELQRWGGLNQSEIDRRVSEGYAHVK